MLSYAKPQVWRKLNRFYVRDDGSISMNLYGGMKQLHMAAFLDCRAGKKTWILEQGPSA